MPVHGQRDILGRGGLGRSRQEALVRVLTGINKRGTNGVVRTN
jgi:hypothetical protein